MTYSLVIKNGNLVTDSGIVDNSGIAVDDGKIAVIAKTPHLPKNADQVIDARGRFVIPGTIDPHTHIMEPGFEWRADWKSETEAAAVGGVTLVIDHAWNVPPALRPADFKRKIEIASKKAIVDFGLHGGGTPEEDVIKSIPDIIKLGAASIKMYLSLSVPEYPEVPDGTLLKIMDIVSKNNGIASIHAENRSIIETYEKEIFDVLGRRDPLAHPDSRPSFAEKEATEKSIKYAEHTSCTLYIVHVSAKEAAEAIRSGKKQGIRIYGETCPHYLLLTRNDMERSGPYLKCNPPLRSSDSTRALWRAVQNGTIDCIGTDHCPYPRKEKEPGWKDIRKAAPGLSGLAEKTALMLTKGVLEDRITMNDFVKLCCKNPAKIFGLYPQKGTIQIGSDADLVILDTKNRIKVSLEKLRTRSEFSPYEGWELKGWPTHTIVRGTVVFQEGEVIGRPGFGRYVPRKNN